MAEAELRIAPRVHSDRLAEIASLSLKSGSHTPDSTFCVMEAAAHVACEPGIDYPAL